MRFGCEACVGCGGCWRGRPRTCAARGARRLRATLPTTEPGSRAAVRPAGSVLPKAALPHLRRRPIPLPHPSSLSPRLGPSLPGHPLSRPAPSHVCRPRCVAGWMATIASPTARQARRALSCPKPTGPPPRSSGLRAPGPPPSRARRRPSLPRVRCSARSARHRPIGTRPPRSA